MIKTMYTWKDTVTWVHIQFGNNFDEYYLEHHAKQIQIYVISCVWRIICVMILLCFYLCWCSFLSFFLYFRRPNLITGQSGWQVPDKVDFFLFFGKPRLNPQWIWSVMGKNILQCLWACHHLPNWPSYSTSMTLFLTRNFLTPSTQSNLFPILICFFLILIRIPFRKPI